MPLYICYCPDYSNALEKRLAVRAAHQALGAQSREEGTIVFGRAFLSHQRDAGDRDQEKPVALTKGMAGSTMIYRFPTIDAAWARIKADPYWVNGVWNKEKVIVRELADGPGDETARFV